MEKIIENMKALCGSILNDIDKPAKAAHARVRKATLELEKVAKEYRKASIAADK